MFSMNATWRRKSTRLWRKGEGIIAQASSASGRRSGVRDADMKLRRVNHVVEVSWPYGHIKVHKQICTHEHLPAFQ